MSLHPKVYPPAQVQKDSLLGSSSRPDPIFDVRSFYDLDGPSRFERVILAPEHREELILEIEACVDQQIDGSDNDPLFSEFFDIYMGTLLGCTYHHASGPVTVALKDTRSPGNSGTPFEHGLDYRYLMDQLSAFQEYLTDSTDADSFEVRLPTLYGVAHNRYLCMEYIDADPLMATCRDLTRKGNHNPRYRAVSKSLSDAEEQLNRTIEQYKAESEVEDFLQPLTIMVAGTTHPLDPTQGVWQLFFPFDIR